MWKVNEPWFFFARRGARLVGMQLNAIPRRAAEKSQKKKKAAIRGGRGARKVFFKHHAKPQGSQRNAKMNCIAQGLQEIQSRANLPAESVACALAGRAAETQRSRKRNIKGSNSRGAEGSQGFF
jgi:hypothetical protein